MANMQALSHKTHLSTNVSNGLALLLVALSVICGLFSFVLCLAAEGSRTEVTIKMSNMMMNRFSQVNYDHNSRI